MMMYPDRQINESDGTGSNPSNNVEMVFDIAQNGEIEQIVFVDK